MTTKEHEEVSKEVIAEDEKKNGRGNNKPTLEYLPEKHNIQNGYKVYTSGKGGIFTPGIPIGEVAVEDKMIKVSLFSDLNQVTFANVDLGNIEKEN